VTAYKLCMWIVLAYVQVSEQFVLTTLVNFGI